MNEKEELKVLKTKNKELEHKLEWSIKYIYDLERLVGCLFKILSERKAKNEKV